MHPAPLWHDDVQRLAQLLQQRGWMLSTAESCTGGMIAAACTDLPGSSAWFDSGFVTYSNAAKARLLGVPEAMLQAHGAVSEAVVRAMAQGAVVHSEAQTAVAVSGVAGPGGGSREKPVGMVWMAWQLGTHTYSECLHWAGDRHAVRTQATQHALRHLCSLLAAMQ